MQKKMRLIGFIVTGFILVSWMISAFPIQTQAAPTDCGDLFISEYIEGSSYNKAIEIYNGTGGSVDLNAEGYSIEMYFNGNTSPGLTLNLTGSIADGDVFVIAHSSAVQAILDEADQTNGSNWYNGNDAVILKRGGTIIDAFGQVGVDPGTAWGSGDTSAINHTLRRLSTIGTGDTDETDAFDPATEWVGYAQDTFDGLGSHTTTGCDTGETAPTVSSTSPTNNATDIAVDANITINFSENVDLTGTWFDISCTTSGAHTASVSGGPQSFTLNPAADFAINETCTVTIYAAQVTDQDLDDPPNEMDSDYGFSFTTASGSSVTFIHTIQGAGDTSPLEGNTVTVEGIVVGDFQDTVSGFYVQEEDSDADGNPLTSEGVYVYSTNAVEVGDQVQVTGTVDEYFGETQIASVSDLSILSTGNVLPSTASPTLPVTAVDDWEHFEGMRVNFPQTLVVTEIYQLGRYGQLTLADQRLCQPTHIAAPGTAANAVAADNLLHTIILDDNSNVQNPDPIRWPSPTGLSAANTVRGGDSVSNLEGIITYRYDFYRVYPTTDPTFSASNPRTTAPTSNGTLRVASFNVLNYFSTLDDSGSICGPLSNLGCRGADTAAEFTRQRAKIIDAIIALDADIVGLIEIENHPTDAALQDLVNGLNAVAGIGTYSYIPTGPIGDDAIKVALIFQTASVAPQGASAILDSNVDPTFLDDYNRPALAQTFAEIASGESLTVIVNHLKSKGSDCNSIGDLDTGDGQGNCNITRTNAATALVNWLATDPTGSTDPDFIIIGDLNSYALEDPITALSSGGYTDLLNTYYGTSAYSYVFDGQLGYLDYAMVSPSFVGQVTSATTWHINADEPIVLDYNTEYKSTDQITSLYAPDAYRASDHDPVVIDLFMPYGLADMSDLGSGYEVAAHKAPHNIWLGPSVDDDTTFAAGSDDGSDNGVSITSGTWSPGQTVTIQVDVQVDAGYPNATAWFSGWFDWNLNGTFEAGERTVNQTVNLGQNIIEVTVPIGAQIGTGDPGDDYMPVRFRLYESVNEPTAAVISPMAAELSGSVTGGEVEDYVWGFTPTAIKLQNFESRTSTTWMPFFIWIATISTICLWGWHRYQKGKHTA